MNLRSSLTLRLASCAVAAVMALQLGAMYISSSHPVLAGGGDPVCGLNCYDDSVCTVLGGLCQHCVGAAGQGHPGTCQ